MLLSPAVLILILILAAQFLLGFGFCFLSWWFLISLFWTHLLSFILIGPLIWTYGFSGGVPVCVLSHFSRVWLCDPMACSLPWQVLAGKSLWVCSLCQILPILKVWVPSPGDAQELHINHRGSQWQSRNKRNTCVPVHIYVCLTFHSVAKTKTDETIYPKVPVNGTNAMTWVFANFNLEATPVEREDTDILYFHLALYITLLIIIKISGLGAKHNPNSNWRPVWKNQLQFLIL